MTRDRDSMYHSLQTQLVSRFGTGSILTLAYTLSKSTSNTGLGNADAGLTERNTYTDSTDPELDRARSAIDRRHVFAGSMVLALPRFEDKSSAMKNIFGDWEFSTIVQASSGYPYTIFVGQVPGLSSGGNLTGVGYAGVQRPERVG